MANNLKKFTTEAEYTAATLNYPAVSWVVSGDTVHFDKTAPAVPNDKVMVYAYTENSSDDLILWNEAATPNFTSITVNDTEVPNPNSTYKLDDVEIGTHLVKYGFDSTVIGDWFTGDIGGKASIFPIEVLIPSKITNIDDYPFNINKMVVEATTPPQIEGLGSIFGAGVLIYVPDSVVNAYKEDVGWGEIREYIYPISEYQGNLPV